MHNCINIVFQGITMEQYLKVEQLQGAQIKTAQRHEQKLNSHANAFQMVIFRMNTKRFFSLSADWPMITLPSLSHIPGGNSRLPEMSEPLQNSLSQHIQVFQCPIPIYPQQDEGDSPSPAGIIMYFSYIGLNETSDERAL